MHHLHRFTSITILIFSLSSPALGQTVESQAKALYREGHALGKEPEAAKKRLALQKFLEAARLFHQTGVTYNELVASFSAAFMAEELNEYSTARDMYRASLPLFDIEQKEYKTTILFKVARFSLLIGDRAVALDYFIQLAHAYEKLGEVERQATTESDIGGVYYQLGKYDEALHYLNLALGRRKQFGKSCDIAATLTNIGAVQLTKGEWTKALDSLKWEALPLYNTSPECELSGKYPTKTECANYLAATLINIGKVYYDLADYQSALCFYERAAPLITYKEFAAALANNLGTVDYKLRRYRSALARFRKAKALHADLVPEALTNIGLTESGLATLAEALRLRREAGNENGEASTLNGLGEVYNRLGRPKEALESFNRAAQLFGSAGDRSGEATALTNAMLSWRMLGNRKIAISSGRLAVDRFQELRVEARGAVGEIERTYLRTTRQAYQNLAELLIEEGLFEQAIQVLSMYQDAQSFDPAGDGKAKQLDVGQLLSAQQAIAAIPSFRGIALYTLVADSKLYVLAVNRGGIKVFSRAIASQAVDQKVKNFLSVLRCADRDPYQPGSELYDLIFKSTLITDKRTTLETALKSENAAALVWSLDRPLNTIPMAALYDATAKQFLIEKYQLAVFTRNDAESFKREPKPWLHGIGLGTSRQFHGQSPIPGAEASLAAIFGNEATQQPGVLSGKTVVNEEFTARTLEDLDGRWPLIHVVSHFVLTGGNSRLSYLLLGNGDRYTLSQMRESPDLFTGVELLTVPVCDSALQDADFYGKETEALADLAQRLGARSVIASLWKVSYHVTPKLMLRFYELARAHHDWSKAELLRQAQLSLLRGEISIRSEPGIARGSCGPQRQSRQRSTLNPKTPFAHPFYWSAFVLYGSGR
jgi:CHAT domain-containing protein/Tfp pilus assembly protein PilF